MTLGGFVHYPPPNVTNHILLSQTFLHSSVVDTYIWSTRQDGLYTAQAGYRWLLQSRQQMRTVAQHDSWLWIWKLPAPEKVKLLCWLICHGAVPTASLLNHRGMLNSPICNRCRSGPETILHCLRNCTLSKRIWVELGFDGVAFFSIMDPKSWLLHSTTGNRVHLFLATIWWLWRARNMACIGGETIHNFQVHLHIESLVPLLVLLFPSPSSSSGPPRLVSWHATRDANVVLSVDGSSIGNPSPSGFSGILRSSNGVLLHGFAGNMGITNSLHAELFGLLHGLSLAWNKG